MWRKLFGGIGKRTFVEKVKLSDVAERVPPNQMKQFMEFVKKNEMYKTRLLKSPEHLPKIDWDYYRANVRDNYRSWVDHFEKKYNHMNTIFDKRHEMIDTVVYYDSIEKETEELLERICEFKEASEQRIEEYCAEFDRIQELTPFEEMTMEEFCDAYPEHAPDYRNRPTFWPHTPEEQRPGPAEPDAHEDSHPTPTDEPPSDSGHPTTPSVAPPTPQTPPIPPTPSIPPTPPPSATSSTPPTASAAEPKKDVCPEKKYPQKKEPCENVSTEQNSLQKADPRKKASPEQKSLQVSDPCKKLSPTEQDTCENVCPEQKTQQGAEPCEKVRPEPESLQEVDPCENVCPEHKTLQEADPCKKVGPEQKSLKESEPCEKIRPTELKPCENVCPEQRIIQEAEPCEKVRPEPKSLQEVDPCEKFRLTEPEPCESVCPKQKTLQGAEPCEKVSPEPKTLQEVDPCEKFRLTEQEPCENECLEQKIIQEADPCKKVGPEQKSLSESNPCEKSRLEASHLEKPCDNVCPEHKSLQEADPRKKVILEPTTSHKDEPYKSVFDDTPCQSDRSYVEKGDKSKPQCGFEKPTDDDCTKIVDSKSKDPCAILKPSETLMSKDPCGLAKPIGFLVPEVKPSIAEISFETKCIADICMEPTTKNADNQVKSLEPSTVLGGNRMSSSNVDKGETTPKTDQKASQKRELFDGSNLLDLKQLKGQIEDSKTSDSKTEKNDVSKADIPVENVPSDKKYDIKIINSKDAKPTEMPKRSDYVKGKSTAGEDQRSRKDDTLDTKNVPSTDYIEIIRPPEKNTPKPLVSKDRSMPSKLPVSKDIRKGFEDSPESPNDNQNNQVRVTQEKKHNELPSEDLKDMVDIAPITIIKTKIETIDSNEFDLSTDPIDSEEAQFMAKGVAQLLDHANQSFEEAKIIHKDRLKVLEEATKQASKSADRAIKEATKAVEAANNLLRRAKANNIDEKTQRMAKKHAQFAKYLAQRAIKLKKETTKVLEDIRIKEKELRDRENK